jgi:hypothetical protein
MSAQWSQLGKPRDPSLDQGCRPRHEPFLDPSTTGATHTHANTQRDRTKRVDEGGSAGVVTPEGGVKIDGDSACYLISGEKNRPWGQSTKNRQLCLLCGPHRGREMPPIHHLLSRLVCFLEPIDVIR